MTDKLKVAFCGTPDFAVPSLNKLIERGYQLTVFTQPDRPKGRNNKLVAPPVKEIALKNNIPVFQFEKIRSDEGVRTLKKFAPDLMVTAAFGQILSQENLDIPPLGCINVHASLLPKYRGAAPIQWSIIDGEEYTGVTTMMTDIGLDTGDILLKEKVKIGEDENCEELFNRLSLIGADLLVRTIDELLAGTLPRIKQDANQATRCAMLKKETGKIDFRMTSQQIHNLVRGTYSWPCAHAYMDDELVKIWVTKKVDTDYDYNKDAEPGMCVIANPKIGLFIKTGDGIIEVKELQFQGSKRMDAKSLLLGKKLQDRKFI